MYTAHSKFCECYTCHIGRFYFPHPLSPLEQRAPFDESQDSETVMTHEYTYALQAYCTIVNFPKTLLALCSAALCCNNLLCMLLYNPKDLFRHMPRRC